MQCDEFDSRLNKLLDLRRAPQRDPYLRRHARACPHCAAQLTATMRLLRGLSLGLGEVPPLSNDFAQRVVHRVVQEAAPSQISRTRRARSMPVAIATAATLLLAVLPGVGYLMRSQGPGARNASPAPASTGDVAYASSTTPANTPPVIHDSPWTLYGHSILDLYPEKTRERHRQQVSEFAEDLRPITTPFNAAVTALKRTIPVNRSTDKSPPNASVTPRTLSVPTHA